MYSWGDDTSTWKKPGGYDYGSARKPYLDDLAKEADAKGPRTYTSKKGPNLQFVDPKGKAISTDSSNPLVLLVDGTGSMQTWPAEIFDRLPLLYQTLSKYRPDMEVTFSVIGDANSDQWPVQVSDFGKGPILDDYLKAVHAEGKGGPGIRESYELWAYFMLEHCKTPKAERPLMVIMGDEKFYDTINPEQVAKYLGDTVQPTDARQVWGALAQRFDIYLLRKSYPGRDAEINGQWGEVLGPQKIIPVDDPTRVVDVAMGIVAKLWGEESDFKGSLSARQDSEGIAKVEASLKYMPEVGADMKSTTGAAGSKKSKELEV